MQRFTPADDRETAACVREAAATGESLEIISRGTKRNYGRPAAASGVLDISGLCGVLDYKPEELVFTARAGTSLSEVHQMLGVKNQMLGFEPPDWGALFGAASGTQTLGGIVAADVNGPRRMKSGSVRDHVIGCRFVNGAGELIRAGGPVIKNVTGFDIPKLMCGALGTLGVLTEITFRVFPRPQRNAALLLRGCEPQSGLRALTRVAGLAAEPTALSYLPDEKLAVIRVEGSAAAVGEKLELLKRELPDFESSIADDDGAQLLFRNIGDASVLAAAGDLWRLCIPPAAAAKASVELSGTRWFADWAGALIWVEAPASAETTQRLRAIAAKYTGHATLFRASAESRVKISVFEPETPVRRRVTESVKKAFDPDAVLNPGRMFEYL